MIEGAALFFLLCFIYNSIPLIRGNFSNKKLLLTFIFLTLAFLQKITTVLPAMLIIYLYIISISIHKRISLFNKINIKIFLVFFSSTLIAIIWLKYTDLIKSENPIGSLITSAHLAQWNYGTISQRISSTLWLDVIYERNIKNNSFYIFGIGCILFSLLNTRLKSPKKIIFFSFILFLAPFLSFTNLHIIHNYYQTANSVFFSIAAGISICYILDRYLLSKPIVYLTLIFGIIISNYFHFSNQYLPYLKNGLSYQNSRTILVSEFIKNNTPTQLPIVIYGYDWSSEIAFYSERKSLTVPTWGNFEVDVIQNPNKYLKSKPSAYILCPVSNLQHLRILVESSNPNYNIKNLIVEALKALLMS
jgi:hypothetical protein